MNQSPAALMSVRAALAAVIVTALVSFSSIVPRTPDRVSWIAVFWLSVYVTVMLAQAAWLRRALRPRAIAAATLWFGGLIALPWIYLVPWRPEGLPPTSIEFAFIVAKLSVSAILFAIGAALVVYEASRLPPPPLTAA